MTIRLHRGDLPSLSGYKGSVAIDTEAMGLDPNRDRLCVVQMSPGDGSAPRDPAAADIRQVQAGELPPVCDNGAWPERGPRDGREIPIRRRW